MYYSIEKRITARTVYLIVFYISAIMMTAITFYALYQSVIEFAATGKIVIGEILVRTEFPFKGLAFLKVAQFGEFYVIKLHLMVP